MRRPSMMVALTLSLLSSACAGAPNEATADDPAIPRPTDNQGIVAGALEVRAARPNITLRNTTEQVIGYMVIDKDQMVVALYPPCNQQCPLLVQGSSTVVTYPQIGGYTERSTEAVVLWWTYRRGADGSLRPESAVQTTRVRL